MAAPHWLIAQPIAHRGLHDRARHLIENTLSAAEAAISHGFAIECDVQLSSDGIAYVFHDDHLDRLTPTSGFFHALSSKEIEKLELKDTSDSIPTLAALLDLIQGRVPLICEMKSRFDHTIKIAEQTAKILEDYRGPVALKSFDPELVIAAARFAPTRPRGFIGESIYDDPEWDFLTQDQKQDFASLRQFDAMKPDFLSWYIQDVDHAVPRLAREELGLPIMTWTVRTEAQRDKAHRFADQIVFEGFIP